MGQAFEDSACPLQCGPDAENAILYHAMSSSDAINLRSGYATDLGIAKGADVEGFCYPTVLTKYLNMVESVEQIWKSKKISKKDMLTYLGRRELVPKDLDRVVQAAQKVIHSPFSKYSKAVKSVTGRGASSAAAARRQFAYFTADRICFSHSGRIGSVADSKLQHLKSSGKKMSQFEKYALREDKAVHKALGKLTKICKSGPLAQLTLLMSAKKEVKALISPCTFSQLVAQLLNQVVQAWSIKEAGEDQQVLFDIRAQMAIVGTLGVEELVVEKSRDDLKF